MNTQYFIYAIEVEKTGSITQAANNLFMSQPTLSKAIRDMESSVGFPVFKRTSKGVVPTQRGTEFLIYAKKIAAQLQKMDAILHAQDTSHQLFSLAIPRVSYIAQAASEYVCTFDNQRDMEVDILETSSMRVIDSVAYGHYVLGIIRYHTEDEDYFLKSLAEAGLQYELLWQSGYVALMRHDHPLAQREQLTARDFDPYEYKDIYSNDEDAFNDMKHNLLTSKDTSNMIDWLSNDINIMATEKDLSDKNMSDLSKQAFNLINKLNQHLKVLEKEETKEVDL